MGDEYDKIASYCRFERECPKNVSQRFSELVPESMELMGAIKANEQVIENL